jgi:hypothetical protein
MSATAKPRRKRRRKREAREHRAAIKPYIAELRAKVPPLVVDQAAALIAILLGR